MITIGVVPSSFSSGRLTINQDYMEGLWRAGAVPVLFPETSDPDRLSFLLDQVDGLMLTGGEDVEPSLFGESREPFCGESCAARDEMEFPLCLEALKRRLPILAICRGHQLLSCALGGTLYQDLEKQYGNQLIHPRHDTPADPVHDVSVVPDTLLSAIVGTAPLGVNSRHHQGIKTLGKGLVACATAPDGLIEGIELPGYPFVLGVQWHPESLAARYPAHQKLFDAFVQACENHRS